MGTLLDKALTPAAMNHAWRFYRNDRGLWCANLPVERARDDWILHMLRLVDDVRAGQYRPEVMRCFEIPKADGSTRLISAACVRDKVLQRAVLSALEPVGEARFLDSSYGFRPAMTLEMAHARVRELVRDRWVWLVDADIEQCFDAIAHRLVLRELARWSGDREVSGLVKAWIEAVPARFRPYGPRYGLPQGMVLSPFLCNVHLHRFDEVMRARGIPCVRFADDFILFARSEAKARAALGVARKALARLKLSLNEEKTEVARSSKRRRFLGKRLPASRPRFRP